MKTIRPFNLLLPLFILSACSGNHTVARDALGHPQPINVDTNFAEVPDACRDSLFLALQTKPYAQMTAYEHAYFEQKWNECNGSSTPKFGDTPEWIVAALELIGAIATIAVLILK